MFFLYILSNLKECNFIYMLISNGNRIYYLRANLLAEVFVTFSSTDWNIIMH